MWKRLQSRLSDIPTHAPLAQQQAALLQIFLLIIIGGCLIGLLLSFLTAEPNQGLNIALIANLLLFLTTSAALILLRRGHFQLAANLAAVTIILGLTIAIIASGLNNGGGALLAFAIPVTLAGLVLGRAGVLLASSLSVGVVVVIGLLETLAPSIVGSLAIVSRQPLMITATFLLLIGVLSLLIDRFGNSLREALTNAMIREHELERLRTGLEDTVARRTDALQQALGEVAQREARLAQTLVELRTSETTIRGLGAPVIPVLPGVLVAPLVGVLDSDRAATLADNVLAMVKHVHAHQVIFDITGVPLVDTQVAQVLVQTAAAVRLLGARALLVGIRPEVAQTIIALGLDFANIATYPSLQEAIAAILATHVDHRLNGSTLNGSLASRD